MNSITLSAPEFKALASETRTSVLKFLLERNHTLSELAQKLDLATPTVKQHLEQLENAGLIEVIDDGHKWKYYKLTRKGTTIFKGQNEPLPVLILLSASTMFAIALMYGLFSAMPANEYSAQTATTTMNQTMPVLKTTIETPSPAPTPDADRRGTPDENALQQPEPPAEPTTPPLPLPLGIIALAIASALAGYLRARIQQA